MDAQTLFDFKVNTIDGKPFDLSSLKGKKVLIVNTASECGYTPQYEDLQNLHEQFGSKVAVLGFPANNFGGQEPGANLEIAQFCKKNYGVSFQMFEKIDVVGSKAHPLFVWLAKTTGDAPRWNFSKYLIDESGEVIAFFPSGTNPLEEAIVGKL
jgi:glutathione peroxidase